MLYMYIYISSKTGNSPQTDTQICFLQLTRLSSDLVYHSENRCRSVMSYNGDNRDFTDPHLLVEKLATENTSSCNLCSMVLASCTLTG